VNGRDSAELAAMAFAFALLATAHLAIVAGLLRQPPRWRSVAALVIAPLAPYWAIRDRMYVRAVAWLVGAVAYAIARRLAV
jgi:hypothetical protein